MVASIRNQGSDVSVTTFGQLKRAKYGEADRPTPSQRGYDSEWQRLRREVLLAAPLCNDCLLAGRYEAATEVHHVEKVRNAAERRLDATNLMPLCKRCHSKRTRRGE